MLLYTIVYYCALCVMTCETQQSVLNVTIIGKDCMEMWNGWM